MPSARSSIAVTLFSSANFPIHKLFERSCELGLWRLTANKMPRFRHPLHRRHRGKLATVIDQIEHGIMSSAPISRAPSSSSMKVLDFPPQRTLLNNLTDFGLKKGWTISMRSVRRSKPSPTVSPLPSAMAQRHVDFPLLQRIALPITTGSSAIRHQNPRYARHPPMRVPAWRHSVGGWTAKQIHQAVLTTFHLSDKVTVSISCYDLRKLKGHGLIELTNPLRLRSPRRYPSRVALSILPQRLCGHSPTAASTTGPTQNIAKQSARGRLPRRQSHQSNCRICWQPPERHTADINVKVVLSRIASKNLTVGFCRTMLVIGARIVIFSTPARSPTVHCERC